MMSLRVELQTGGVEFEICEYLPGTKGLTKNEFELHYGKCRIQHFGAHTRDYYTVYTSFFCINSDLFF